MSALCWRSLRWRGIAYTIIVVVVIIAVVALIRLPRRRMIGFKRNLIIFTILHYPTKHTYTHRYKQIVIVLTGQRSRSLVEVSRWSRPPYICCMFANWLAAWLDVCGIVIKQIKLQEVWVMENMMKNLHTCIHIYIHRDKTHIYVCSVACVRNYCNEIKRFPTRLPQVEVNSVQIGNEVGSKLWMKNFIYIIN